KGGRAEAGGAEVARRSRRRRRRTGTSAFPGSFSFSGSGSERGWATRGAEGAKIGVFRVLRLLRFLWPRLVGAGPWETNFNAKARRRRGAQGRRGGGTEGRKSEGYTEGGRRWHGAHGGGGGGGRRGRRRSRDL